MLLPRSKSVKFVSFSTFFLVLLSVMFLVTVYLSFSLLTIDHSSMNQVQANIRYEQKSTARKKLVSSKHKLAILVPYRDRFEELLEFVPYIFNFLSDQSIDYEIFLLNQVDLNRFNRASLINVGFLQTKDEYDYIAMHDVDLLPLNKDIKYYYPQSPFHIAAPDLHPRYHYPKFIGGILLINREQFELVNGLSNRYWGWGLEDDEFYVRLKDAGLNITRPANISTNTSNTFRHIHGKERKRDTTKCYNQKEVTRKRDRQTGLHDVKYTILSKKKLTIEEAPLTVINIQLICDHASTPWCDCNNSIKKTTVKNKT